MSLRDSRREVSKEILEGRFIKRVLTQETRSISDDLTKRLAAAGLTAAYWRHVNFSVKGQNNLHYRHLKKHRFMDMKTRNTKNGKVRKENVPIHNKMIYSHLNDIIKELTFGFTDAVKEELKSLENW
jgi:hypothetical protein